MLQLSTVLRGLSYDEQLAALTPGQQASGDVQRRAEGKGGAAASENPSRAEEPRSGTMAEDSHAPDGSDVLAGPTDGGGADGPEPPAILDAAVAAFEQRSEQGEEQPPEDSRTESGPAQRGGEVGPGVPGGGSGASQPDPSRTQAEQLVPSAQRARDEILFDSEGLDSGSMATDASDASDASDADTGTGGLPTQMKPVQKRSVAHGRELQAAQEKLNQLGFPCGRPDGAYGANTRKAVIAFQKAHELEQDGILGPATSAALDKAAGGGAPGAIRAGRPAHGNARARSAPASKRRGPRRLPPWAAKAAKAAAGDKKYGEAGKVKFAEIYQAYRSKLSKDEQDVITTFMSDWVLPKVCPFVQNPEMTAQEKAILAGAMLAALGRAGRGQDCGDWVMRAYTYSQGDEYIRRGNAAVKEDKKKGTKAKRAAGWYTVSRGGGLYFPEHRWKKPAWGSGKPTIKKKDLVNIQPGHWLLFHTGSGNHSVLVIKVGPRDARAGTITVEVMEGGTWGDGTVAPRYSTRPLHAKGVRTWGGIYNVMTPEKSNAYARWLMSKPKRVP